ncbi:2-C-methyl-D-erythritol 4-phosphate cytidylyltransferase [Candidatus Woesearchaeota archaeon CG11_big_fil_rev_8_21_14_0_20_43_8]|nr:MAG: 2-C-methyl-D-erythritol 4-phosphate cytidylyltransferase [Candidatus Woesearchaeota archaeon CG11_big_fil_rev_8_21_14_0_20_43_8]PIO05075.1 MAG: 2-C-methyl-D-erythritol 4-phosphate cytidylyltransferase [Candidatus Woesearchaeota archaeon CG08_land_8_20_14_0_20_43_7]
MNTAVILGGGSGKRFGAENNKIFTELSDIPIIAHTLQAFENNLNIDEIILVLRKEDKDMIRKVLTRHHFSKLRSVIVGGDERQDSVSNAIRFLDGKNTSDDSIVLIHNGANPLVTQHEIDASIEAVTRFGASAVGSPVKDTIKLVEDEFSISTPDRQNLYAMQTPQCARFWLLRSAHEKANEERHIGTDDASLIERLGHKVKIIPASEENIKITRPFDLLIAETILNKKKVNRNV